MQWLTANSIWYPHALISIITWIDLVVQETKITISQMGTSSRGNEFYTATKYLLGKGQGERGANMRLAK